MNKKITVYNSSRRVTVTTWCGLSKLPHKAGRTTLTSEPIFECNVCDGLEVDKYAMSCRRRCGDG